jgi:hypothetical protein
MAIHEALHEAGHELTHTQIAALMEHGSKQTVSALFKNMQPHLTNPLITCLICIHPYHSPNVEGNTETPAITACGHIFGNTCIASWFSEPSSPTTCPLCRFELKYKECKHPIRPLPAFSPPPPPQITVEQVPRRCGKCEVQHHVHDLVCVLEDMRDRRGDLVQDMEDLREKGATVGEKGEMVYLSDEEMREREPEAWRLFKEAEGLVVAGDGKFLFCFCFWC